MTQRTALITGGVGGIGTAICRKLIREGHRVVANYAIPGSEQTFLQTAEKENWNGNASLAFGDVSDYASISKMMDKIHAEVGPVDILVNCAGITRDATLRKMTPEQWDQVIRTNLYSVFNVTRHLIDGMCERGFGRVVNIASVNALKGQFGQTNYSAAKAGVLGFTMALAQEVARKGVTVNAVSPGYIDTPMTQAMRPDIRQQVIDSIPAGRVGDPHDIGHVVAFLASDAASYITGANISVNGGLHMHA